MFNLCINSQTISNKDGALPKAIYIELYLLDALS